MMTIGIPRVLICELRPGIGLCDDCGEPRWPQEYLGYGIMMCLDCIAKDKKVLRAPENSRQAYDHANGFGGARIKTVKPLNR